MNGEINLETDGVELFMARIDAYLHDKNLKPIEMSAECKLAESFTLEEVGDLTQDECFDYAYMLYQYCNCINTEKERQKIGLNWCNDTLATIITREAHNFTQYTKHEMKIAFVVSNDVLGKKIDEWRSVAQARVMMLDGREHFLRKQADCLMEKGKRK